MDQSFPFENFFSKSQGKQNPTSPKTPLSKNVDEIGEKIHGVLQSSVPEEKYQHYFKGDLKVTAVDEEKVTFMTNTNLLKTMIEKDFLPDLKNAVFQTTQRHLQIQIDLHPQAKGRFKKRGKIAPHSNDLLPSREDLLNAIDSTVIKRLNPVVRPNYIDHSKTFENFTNGKNSQMAMASLASAAKNPGSVFPLIYLYSDPGLGKTHLLHSVANVIRDHSPQLRIYYITARDFMNEMVESMAHKTIGDFRKKYTEHTDVLFIDDTHDLKNKQGTQNEFFYIFNELYNKGKQLIFTGNAPPEQIGLEEKLATRLSWGLILDIQRPDFETRLAIVKGKASEEDIYLTDDIMNLIATYSDESVRELEGNLVRLAAYSSVMHIDLDLDVAKAQLIKGRPDKKRIIYTAETILEGVCQFYNIPKKILTDKGRQKEIVLARQTAMYLIYKMTATTLTEIGKLLGKRDHSTVLHGVLKIKNLYATDQDFNNSLSALRQKIRAGRLPSK